MGRRNEKEIKEPSLTLKNYVYEVKQATLQVQANPVVDMLLGLGFRV